MTNIDLHHFGDQAAEWFSEIHVHNATPRDGITRCGYSPEETEAMKYVGRATARLPGTRNWFDHAGNLHVCLGDPAKPVIAIGSHLDTVHHGGRFDGTAGVVAGMCVLKEVCKHGFYKEQPVELIVFRAEESATFGRCYLGSAGMFGQLTEVDFLSRHGDLTLWQWMCAAARADALAMNWDEEISPMRDRATAARERARYRAFYELHIEQGPQLDAVGEPFAVVDGILGNVRFPSITVAGRRDHSGTTPMGMRLDAVRTAAHLVHEWNLEMRRIANKTDRWTCGVFRTDEEACVSAVAARVHLALEYRSSSRQQLDTVTSLTMKGAEFTSQTTGVGIDLGDLVTTDPVRLDTTILDRMLEVKRVRTLSSGAGHDAAVMQKMGIPTGMILVRNQNGSHNRDEAMRMEDFVRATRFLEDVVTTQWLVG